MILLLKYLPFVSLLVFIVSSGTSSELRAQQPNIIVIISDDAGWADFGFQDPITGRTTNVPTPHLDALASSGVRFSNAYTGSVCSPSRAMLTTGQYGGRFGYENNIGAGSGQIGTEPLQGLPTSATTIWEQMQSIGYATAAVGKWHLGAHTNNTLTGELGNRPQNQGVENFQGIIGGSRSYWMGASTGDSALRRTLSDGAGGSLSDQVIENQYNASDYVTDVFGDLTVDYIADNHDSGQPFFMYSSFTAPHTPLQATVADLAAVDALNLGVSNNRRLQIAMQIALDRNVGRIIAAVDDPNGDGNSSDSIADNTMIIFLNDNGGDCCDSSPNGSSNGPLRNGKGSQYDGGLRIPMIISGAGIDASVAGTTFDGLVHAIDVLPTAFAAGGGVFQPGEIIDGVNLVPFANGTAAGTSHESLYLRRASGNQSAVRVGNWKLMFRGSANEFELYDLATDIGESNNVAAANPAVVAQLQQVMTDYDVQMDKARSDLRAPDVNQFDEFRYREDAFVAATWSTGNAWTNNLTGTNATMNEDDGYANAVLVFGNKSAGDYTATNDLTRVGGLEFLANRIELVDQGQPLAGSGTATIDGRGVLLAKSLSGAMPEIRLDATIAGPEVYTYDIGLDVNLYDDLTIAGDGNQKFTLSGALREYRAGLKVTKTGTANLSIGGPVELSDSLDLQAGTTEFTDGNVAASLIVRTGATIRVGGVGIVPGSGNNDPAPPLFTTGLDLHFDAASDPPGDNLWQDIAGAANNLDFGGPATPTAVASSNFPALTSAYSISTSGGATGLNGYFDTPVTHSSRDATFEVVLNVTNIGAGTNQVILETGGSTRGIALVLNDDTLTFSVDGDADDIAISTTLATGWHHVVGVIDLAAGDDSISLYLNNAFVGSVAGNVNDWAGGNIFGLGRIADAATGLTGPANDFHGDIAAARFYANVPFGDTEVDQNYQTLLFEGGAPGVPPVTLAIEGNWTQETGASLELDVLNSTKFDRVVVTGTATIAGELTVAPADDFATNLGDQFIIVEADTLTGQFDTVSLPTLTAGKMWQIGYSDTGVSLFVTVSGDYNGDGRVDAADYTVWRDRLGQSVADLTSADGNGDGQVNAADYVVWRSNFGSQVPASLELSNVPEPAAIWAAVVPVALIAFRQIVQVK